MARVMSSVRPSCLPTPRFSTGQSRPCPTSTAAFRPSICPTSRSRAAAGSITPRRRPPFPGWGFRPAISVSLRLLGAREERRAGIAALPEAIGGAGGVRTFRFPGALAEPSCHASVSFTDRNYLAGAKLAFARPAGHGWDVAAAVEARTGRDMHVERRLHECPDGGIPCRQAFRRGAIRWLSSLSSHRRYGAHASLRSKRLSALRATTSTIRPGVSRTAKSAIRACGASSCRWPPLRTACGCRPRPGLDMAAGAEYGVRKYSALGWYDARTPMPDRLPVTCSGYTGDRKTELAWRSNDARYTQVCWDELIARNRMAGGHAVYTLEDRAERIRNLGFDALFTTAPDERLTLRYGFSLPPCPHAQLQTDARPAGGGSYHRHRPVPRGRRHLRQPPAKRPAPSRPHRPRGRPFRLRLCALDAREATVRLSAEYRSDRLRADVALALGDAVVLRRGYATRKSSSPGRSPSGARGGWGSRPIRSGAAENGHNEVCPTLAIRN
ncbi:MAG: hypothetical protein ACLUQ6_05815 [Alistipes onderdonkii]